jgi:hypothetical protein
MNIHKKALFLLWMTLFHSPFLLAQDKAVKEYFDRTGDYAGLFNGQVESAYNAQLFENFPYYRGVDLSTGSVVFKNKEYPDVQMRLDLYKEQLVVLSPKKRFCVILDSKEVERINLYGKTFVRKAAGETEGLKEGFYILLYDNRHFKLFCKEKFNLKRVNFLSHFTSSTNYYLCHNGQTLSVKNKKSFTKLFPQYKKQINRFAREHKLNFNRDAGQSLTALVGYCEELITSNN